MINFWFFFFFLFNKSGIKNGVLEKYWPFKKILRHEEGVNKPIKKILLLHYEF